MPPHMFRTNFLGPLGTTPAYTFCTIFSDMLHVFKSASVQANDVSNLGETFIQVLGPYGWELPDPGAHAPEFRHSPSASTP